MAHSVAFSGDDRRAGRSSVRAFSNSLFRSAEVIRPIRSSAVWANPRERKRTEARMTEAFRIGRIPYIVGPHRVSLHCFYTSSVGIATKLLTSKKNPAFGGAGLCR